MTEVIETEATQLRLMVEGGWPWETVQTELKIYEIMHRQASPAQRGFKYVSLLLAFVLPSRFFYRLKRSLAQNNLYLRAREKWVPVPRLPHTEGQWCRKPVNFAWTYDDWHQQVFDSAPEHADQSSPWYQLVLEYIGSVSGKRVLEVSCGRGGFSNFWHRKARSFAQRTLRVPPSESLVKRPARRKQEREKSFWPNLMPTISPSRGDLRCGDFM